MGGTYRNGAEVSRPENARNACVTWIYRIPTEKCGRNEYGLPLRQPYRSSYCVRNIISDNCLAEDLSFVIRRDP